MLFGYMLSDPVSTRPGSAPTASPANLVGAGDAVTAAPSTAPSAEPTTTGTPTLKSVPPAPKPTTTRPAAKPRTTTPKTKPMTTEPEEVYYKNCAAVRAAGAAPIHRGDPGYAKHLDRDGDGVGCE
ncbi:Excalibur calcium-binding domain-containing protein [Actinoplanes regularis]|uniref:Excalibur calcium-binding domain-containing protein n=1 Tax=Actinoplanes regularis TaxID=52697 RepID=A0A238WMT6_9ACTN|nr:Excalibur calcium-binding domain-containing protein [Actinoplanes regularis]